MGWLVVLAVGLCGCQDCSGGGSPGWQLGDVPGGAVDGRATSSDASGGPRDGRADERAGDIIGDASGVSSDAQADAEAGGADAPMWSQCPADFRPEESDASTEYELVWRLHSYPPEYLCEGEARAPGGRHFCVDDDNRDEQYICGFDLTSTGYANVACEKAPDEHADAWRPCAEPQGMLTESNEHWGRRCWAPPCQYCSHCAGSVESGKEPWSCTRDGDRCCRISCTQCGRCGEIVVRSETECRLAGGQYKSESFCKDFFQSLDPLYRKCIRGECTDEEKQRIREKPACSFPNVPTRNVVMCRD